MSTLIEIVITLFIISSMVLSLDSMHMTAFNQANTAFYTNIALDQLEVIATQLAKPSSKTILELQAKWNDGNQSVLPNGLGQITLKDTGYEIAISWGRYLPNQCEANSLGQSPCLRLSIQHEGGDGHYFA